MELKEITNVVCNHLHVEEGDLYTSARFQELVFARYMIYFIASKCNYSHGYIAKEFKRDRTTIYWALNKAIPDLIATNYNNFRTNLNNIESGLKLGAQIVNQDGVVTGVNLTLGLNKS